MKNIKCVTVLVAIFSFLCVTYDNFAMDGIRNKLTRYVVRDSWVKKHANDAVEKNFDNFNLLLTKMQSALAAEKDKNSPIAKYLALRLQIMKAISDKISSCFIEQLKALDKGKSAEAVLISQIEKDYVRNEAIQVAVDQKIIDLIQDFLPCELMTSSNYFNLVQPKSVTINDRYYITDNDNLSQFNRYASWVESLALAIFMPTLSAEAIDNKLAALQSLGLKTSVYQLIKALREKFLQQAFPQLIKQHLERIEKEIQELEKNIQEGASASRFILVLKKLIQFKDSAYHKFISEAIDSQSSLNTLYQKIKTSLYDILHKKYKLSYQKIDSYTQEKYKEFGLQYADFLNYYNEINQNPAKSQAEADILAEYITGYITKANIKGDNLSKLQQLLSDIKLLKSSIQDSKPLANAFDLLMSMQLGLRTLQALKK